MEWLIIAVVTLLKLPISASIKRADFRKHFHREF